MARIVKRTKCSLKKASSGANPMLLNYGVAAMKHRLSPLVLQFYSQNPKMTIHFKLKMDVTVTEELQIHAPLKTQRRTSTQDEILQTAAAVLEKEMVFLQKETMAMSSRGVTSCISVPATKD